MVSFVICENNSDFGFQVRIRIEGNLPLHFNGRKILHDPIEFIPAHQRVYLFHFHRRKQLEESIIIEATLSFNPGVPGHGGEEGREALPSEVLILQQKVHPKHLRTKVEMALSADPYEALFPEPNWGNGARWSESVWTSSQTQLLVRYKYSHSRLCYEICPFHLDDPKYSSKRYLRDEYRLQRSLPPYMYLEEVYENERGNGMSGPNSFSPTSLFKSERSHWSGEAGQFSTPKESVALPSMAWEWVNEWKIDMKRDADSNGWEYATTWRGPFYGWCRKRCFVRRRRWVRLRQLPKPKAIRIPLIEHKDIDSPAYLFDELMEKLEDPVASDVHKRRLVSYYLQANQKTCLQEAYAILRCTAHESGRLECFEEILQFAPNPQEFAPLVSLFVFHSNKRILAERYGFDIYERGTADDRVTGSVGPSREKQK